MSRRGRRGPGLRGRRACGSGLRGRLGPAGAPARPDALSLAEPAARRARDALACSAALQDPRASGRAGARRGRSRRRGRVAARAAQAPAQGQGRLPDRRGRAGRGRARGRRLGFAARAAHRPDSLVGVLAGPEGARRGRRVARGRGRPVPAAAAPRGRHGRSLLAHDHERDDGRPGRLRREGLSGATGAAAGRHAARISGGRDADDEVCVGGRPRARAQGPGPDHRAPARRGLAAVSERARLGSRRHRPRQDRLLRRGARATRGPRRCAWRCAEAEVRLACGSSPGRRGSCARCARRVRRAGSPPSTGGRFRPTCCSGG